MVIIHFYIENAWLRSPCGLCCFVFKYFHALARLLFHSQWLNVPVVISSIILYLGTNPSKFSFSFVCCCFSLCLCYSARAFERCSYNIWLFAHVCGCEHVRVCVCVRILSCRVECCAWSAIILMYEQIDTTEMRQHFNCVYCTTHNNSIHKI